MSVELRFSAKFWEATQRCERFCPSPFLSARYLSGHIARIIPTIVIVLAFSAPLYAATTTSTILVSSLNPSFIGSSLVATAVVSPPVPDGEKVYFYVSGSLAAIETTIGSVAAAEVAPTIAGEYSVSAIYSGDNSNAASTSNTVTETVIGIQKKLTLISVSPSVNPAVVGEKMTETATISPAVSNGEPITFYADGNVVLGIAKIEGGKATLTSLSPPFGLYSVTALYRGDSTYAPSTSSPLTQVVETNNPSPAHVLIALGDSLAFGTQTSALTVPSDGLQGYVLPCAKAFASQDSGILPKIYNLGVPGESTSSFFTGSLQESTNLNYTSPSSETQYSLLHQVISSEYFKGDSIDAVSVQLGGDDLLNLMDNTTYENEPPAAQTAQAQAALDTFVSNFSELATSTLTELPGVNVCIVGYYDPLSDSPSNPLEAIAKPAVAALNTKLQELAVSKGLLFVNISPLFIGHVDQYTYISSLGFPAGLHCNPTGYGVIAQAIENELH